MLDGTRSAQQPRSNTHLDLYNCNKVDQVSESVVEHLFIEDFRSLTVSRITTLSGAQLIFGTKAFTD